MTFEWHKVGTRLDITWLFNYPAGGKAPPSEPKKEFSFLQVCDLSVKHVFENGLGIPNSFLYWHWSMVGVFLALFALIFSFGEYTWLNLVKKLLIFFNLWEAFGFGVIHGPLHQKFKPPFQDWWYRLTPGTMKYPGVRTRLDVFVEGYLTIAVSAFALSRSVVEPRHAIPVALCSIYEFIFDYGQHLHSYGTQNMHMFVCCCFEDPVFGMQLFLTFFYFCSGACKLGPTFQYMFTSNLLSAKFVVDTPWFESFKKTFYRNVDEEDYRLRPAAYYLATSAALVEMLVPLLVYTPLSRLSIAIFMCMHLFIISTLIIDVFVWNFADAIWYVALYGGFLPSNGKIHPLLATWLVAHACFALYGHVYPDQVPYVVSHRHAAGNWAQGVLVVRKKALAKLGKLKMHAGFPQQGPGWIGEWFSFHAFFAYTYNWNVPTKMLFPLVASLLDPSVGATSSEDSDVVLIHSVLFFDALIAHLRFDGASNPLLVQQLGKTCGFEPGECVLAWAGAFPSFLLPSPKATWKIIDAHSGVLKQGTYTAEDVMNPVWKKPSDIPPDLIPSS